MITTTRTVLQRIFRLCEAERQTLLRAITSQQSFPPYRELVTPDGPVPALHVILSGFACRYASFYDGRRQILSFLFAGDLFNVHACFGQKLNSFMQSLSVVHIANLPIHELLASSNNSSALVQELWRLAAVEEATTRQWLLNVGRRSAIQRLSHLLCECFARLEAVGLAHNDICPFPMTQTDIADALALTPVHVNRTLMELRRAELALLKNRRLTILDAPALRAVAEFQPDYLQLEVAYSRLPIDMSGLMGDPGLTLTSCGNEAG